MTAAAQRKPQIGHHAPEGFAPFALEAPDTWRSKLAWGARQLADFQFASVRNDLLPYMQKAQGCVVDVGCGDMPYRHLAAASSRYVGFDVAHASHVFGYRKTDVLLFDGLTIPLVDESADLVICTEVLEHHPNPTALVKEMHRIAKKDAPVVVTVPWSARMHYLPEDYCRYTSRRLEEMFSLFDKVTVKPRGTDVTAVCNKMIVIFMRSVAGLAQLSPKACAGVLGLGWLMPGAIALGNLSLRSDIGSDQDPLGFTIVAFK
jgi:SAM-dependent methyltransferase